MSEINYFKEPEQFGGADYHLDNRYFYDPLVFEDLYLYQLGRMYCTREMVIDRHIQTDLS